MIHKDDEFIHEYKKNKDWVESYNINFVSKKYKVYGSADINYLFDKNKIEMSWIIFFNNKKYENTNLIAFDGRLNSKKIGKGKFEYSIITPLEKFKVVLRNEAITANIYISGLCPAYFFPENIIDDEISGQKITSPRAWNEYEQRCKITGDLIVKTGEDKGKKVKFDCFGQRNHIWGKVQYPKIRCQNRIIVQFRDMSMTLAYLEKDASPESNGFISKRSGNIPIINVECESLTMDKKNEAILSSEFSYMDAQEDVDLLVGKSLFSIPMPLPVSRSKKFLRFRNYSEYTIIGTNKKGYGVEDHYLSMEMLKLFKSPE